MYATAQHTMINLPSNRATGQVYIMLVVHVYFIIIKMLSYQDKQFNQKHTDLLTQYQR